MSLIGLDIGSTTTKAAAYSAEGTLLAMVRESVTPRHPRPGWWELEPDEVWEATWRALRRLQTEDLVRRDPPRALAISASGREAFPIDEAGEVLGPCIMAGDVRTCRPNGTPIVETSPEEWLQACGHLPERMDPVCRLLWWRQNRPEIMALAKYFLGWHEFITSRLTGRAVTDMSLAGRWLVYDLERRHWSLDRLARFDIMPDLLPEIQPWGSTVGHLKPDLALELGLSTQLEVAVGGFDVSCAALGSGALQTGMAGLVSGSWEDLIAPIAAFPPAHKLLNTGISIGPQPGKAGLAVFALSPNGTAVIDWARNMMEVSLSDLDAGLQASGRLPSPVLAIPHLSGATLFWGEGSRSRGAILGLTLATSPIDIIKGLLEGIAYELSYAAELLGAMGVKVVLLRAVGGGSRSEWWTQLKADLLQLPIEVVDQPEPGTLGAALLAGLSTRAFSDLGQGIEAFVRVERCFEPQAQRRQLHEERMELHKSVVTDHLALGKVNWQDSDQVQEGQEWEE